MSIPAVLHVLKHSKAKQANFAILMRLADHANTAGLAWPSVLTLAEESGYKSRWVKSVLEALVRLGECTREKDGRSYRYRLPVYTSQTKQCTCAVTAPIPDDDDAQVQSTTRQVQLIPEQVQFRPPQVQWSDANLQRPNGTHAEPVVYPDHEPERNQAPSSLSLGQEAQAKPPCADGEICGTPHAPGCCGVEPWDELDDWRRRYDAAYG